MVLVGWKAEDLGKRMALRLQTVSADGSGDQDIAEECVFLTKAQATQLGHFLFRMTGQTAPTPYGPAWLRKLLGRA